MPKVHGTIQERLSIEILLNGIPLERESEAEFKYLGIHISANPSWSSQFSTNLQEGKEVDRNALQKILCQC